MNISFLWNCFRKGSSVVDAIKAKNRGMLGIAIGSVVALAPQLLQLVGVNNVVITQEDAAQIGAAIATLAGLFSTYATSDKVGILPAKSEPTVAQSSDPAQQGDLLGGP